MDEHVVFIWDGEGKVNLTEGTYEVISETYGYDNDTLNPTSVEMDSSPGEYNFTLSASGKLGIYVYDGGTGAGSAIEGATFYRCDSSGNRYGDAITSDSTGFAYIEHLPYDSSYPAYTYFVQTASDGQHSFSEELKEEHLVNSEHYILIENPKIT